MFAHFANLISIKHLPKSVFQNRALLNELISRETSQTAIKLFKFKCTSNIWNSELLDRCCLL